MHIVLRDNINEGLRTKTRLKLAAVLKYFWWHLKLLGVATYKKQSKGSM